MMFVTFVFLIHQYSLGLSHSALSGTSWLGEGTTRCKMPVCQSFPCFIKLLPFLNQECFFFLLNHCWCSLGYDCKNTYYSLLPVSEDDKACANLTGNCWTLLGALPALRTVNQTARQTTQVITNSLELSTDTLRKLPQVHNWFVLVGGYDPSLDDLKLFASGLLLSQA